MMHNIKFTTLELMMVSVALKKHLETIDNIYDENIAENILKKISDSVIANLPKHSDEGIFRGDE